MNDLAARFEQNVDRSTEHHLWTGSVDPARGTARIKVAGKTVTANRVAWELAYGPLPPRVRVLACPDEPACVRVEHLRVDGDADAIAPIIDLAARRSGPRGRKGGGSMREVRPGVWKLSATTAPYTDGTPRRLHRTIRGSKSQAAIELAAFVNELANNKAPIDRDTQTITMDQAMRLFLDKHLGEEKGREAKTIRDYWKLHAKWFAPEIGARFPRDVDEATLDRLFGSMRRAGLSTSRLRQAKSLYAPFFRWAKRRGIVRRNPMAEFELPTSTYVSKERVPPEVEELSLLLSESVRVVPDVAPILVLGAVSGMRRGELVAVRRSRIKWDELRITVDAAIDGKRVKGTKTRKERPVHIDAETMAMLARVCDERDELARAAGVDIPDDAFLFSLAIDCSEPMPPDHLTKRVAVLKEHLGIEDKRPETIARELEALRLYRCAPATRPAGKTGPAPKGGLSYREIGERLGRSERWAVMAVASAQRRQDACERALALDFDGSILALRKFTSSELLDAGFNVSMVAQRQGHGPQVLTNHYSKGRRSADRKAAEHLGRVVHQGNTPLAVADRRLATSRPT